MRVKVRGGQFISKCFWFYADFRVLAQPVKAGNEYSVTKNLCIALPTLRDDNQHSQHAAVIASPPSHHGRQLCTAEPGTGGEAWGGLRAT